VLKVLHISKYYPPHRGGIEDVCYNIVSELKAVYDQQVICFNDSKHTVTDVYEGITVTRAGYFDILSSQALSLSYFFKLRELLKGFLPDIIHFHTPNPLISVYLMYLLKKETKLIVHWHSDIIDQKWLYPFYIPFEKHFLKRADRVIATSNNYCSSSVPLRKVLDKTDIVPNAVDEKKLALQKEEIQPVRRLRDSYGASKLIIFVGRLVPYKGLTYLIKASRLLHGDFKILLIGDGPQKKELERIAQNDPRILFMGRVSNEELRMYLHVADIFAFPSVTKNEAFGVALAEALYCGLPAVCFDIEGSGVSWVNRNGKTGFTVENRNIVKFAEAVNRLLEDDELRNNMGENAQEWVRRNFLGGEAAAKVDKIYQSVLKADPGMENKEFC
jgi:glycosyltransferase involved in cell wall biosynthesis